MQLKERTPYMIRNDGEIFECGFMHPYILKDVNAPFEVNINYIAMFPEQINWFVEHSKQNLKSLLNDCFQCLADCVMSLDNNTAKKTFGMEHVDLENALNVIGLNIEPNFIDEVDTNCIKSCEVAWKELNSRLNQEFLRVRMSGKYWQGLGKDIYFRISSFDFNWFDIIWKIIHDNQNQLSSITISADPQAGKTIGHEVYIISGKPVDHMGIDEFLELPGNPLVEDMENEKITKLNQGMFLNNIFPDFGYFHNTGIYEAYRDIYIRTHFVENKKSNKRTFINRRVV